MRTFLIAEVGSNHEGSLKRALELIEIAKDSGADAVKFQLIPPFKPDWIDKIIEYCKDDIEFMASPFNEAGVNALRGRIKHWKIASTEAANPEFVKLVLKAAKFDTVFISDGATENPNKIVALGPNVVPMSCVVRYPAEVWDYSFQYHGRWGLSDHTEGNLYLPTVAVAAGAVAVEKHFTDDPKRDGPDHAYALTPVQLTEMVQSIRMTEALFTNPKTTITDHVGRTLQWPT